MNYYLIKNFMKISNGIKELARTIIVIMILVAGVSIVSAWTAPICDPTLVDPSTCNAPAPVNVGALSQVKSGALQVNGFRNIGNRVQCPRVTLGKEVFFAFLRGLWYI